MFSNQYNVNIRPDFDFDLHSSQFEIDDVLMKNFGNSMVDDHHDFSHHSIQHISLTDSRITHNDLRLSSLERMFEHQSGLLSPKMGCSVNYEI